MNLIEPATLALLSKALDASSMRHAAHASNIANAHTEGYAPMKVAFEAQMTQLRASLAQGEEIRHADVMAVPMQIETEAVGTPVQIENEVAELSRNTLHYQALLKALDRQLGLVSLALTDGRR